MCPIEEVEGGVSGVLESTMGKDDRHTLFSGSWRLHLLELWTGTKNLQEDRDPSPTLLEWTGCHTVSLEHLELGQMDVA